MSFRRTFPLLVVLATLFMAGGKVEKRRVQVRSAPLMAKPSYNAVILRKLPYGSELDLVGSQSYWCHVMAGADSGWVHQSALTDRKIAAGGDTVAADVKSTDVLMAGKGFSKEVEATYRKDHRELERGYRALDALDEQRPTPEQVTAFAVEGGLGRSGGGE